MKITILLLLFSFVSNAFADNFIIYMNDKEREILNVTDKIKFSSSLNDYVFELYHPSNKFELQQSSGELSTKILNDYKKIIGLNDVNNIASLLGEFYSINLNNEIKSNANYYNSVRKFLLWKELLAYQNQNQNQNLYTFSESKVKGNGIDKLLEKIVSYSGESLTSIENVTNLQGRIDSEFNISSLATNGVYLYNVSNPIIKVLIIKF